MILHRFLYALIVWSLESHFVSSTRRFFFWRRRRFIPKYSHCRVDTHKTIIPQLQIILREVGKVHILLKKCFYVTSEVIEMKHQNVAPYVDPIFSITCGDCATSSGVLSSFILKGKGCVLIVACESNLTLESCIWASPSDTLRCGSSQLWALSDRFINWKLQIMRLIYSINELVVDKRVYFLKLCETQLFLMLMLSRSHSTDKNHILSSFISTHNNIICFSMYQSPNSILWVAGKYY